MEAIKLCPFCGGEAKGFIGGFGEIACHCSNENCGGQLGCGIWFTNEEEAICQWNKRTPDVARLTAELNEAKRLFEQQRYWAENFASEKRRANADRDMAVLQRDGLRGLLEETKRELQSIEDDESGTIWKIRNKIDFVLAEVK
jgi:hypothetical protein